MLYLRKKENRFSVSEYNAANIIVPDFLLWKDSFREILEKFEVFFALVVMQ